MARRADSLAGRRAVLAVAVATCAACGDPADPGTRAPACAATTSVLYPFEGPARSSAVIGDVTGDGADDRVTIVDDAGAYRLDVGEPVAARIALRGDSAYLASVGRVDLDGDGRGDLIVGLPWHDRVLVFRGPLAGALDETAATLTYQSAGNGVGALSAQVGAAALVADVDLDGARDLVVGAPAEREEVCAGQLPLRVLRGPFADGVVLADADAIDLAADPAHRCVGEQLECTAAGFRASHETGWIDYAVPIVTGAR